MSSPVPAGVQSIPELKSLNEILTLSSSQIHIQEYFQKAMTILCRYFPFPYSALLLRDLKKDMFHVEALYGIAKDPHPLSCTGRKGTMGKVIESRQPMAILNLNQEPLYEEMTKGGKRTDRIQPPLICIPLVYGNESFGVININSLFGQADGFDKDFQFLTVLSAVLSPAVRSYQAKKEDALSGSSRSKVKLEDILEEKLTEVLNRIDPYLESKARLGILDDIVSIVERILIKTALERVENVQIAAAQLLGINRNTLRKKIKELKIKVK
jgi:transcriptional regulator with GAF, ATPase, and Fis domain